MALNQLDAAHRCWYAGDLSYKLRPHGQTDVYNWVRKWQKDHPDNPGPLLICCHRRFGKTFVAYCLASIAATSKPRQRVRIYSPTKEQGYDISDDVWPDVIDDKPPDILWLNQDGDLQVFNPRWRKGQASKLTDFSLVKFHGTEIKEGSQARGIGANLIILDECQSMKNLDKVMKRVVGWQVAKKKGCLILMLFTPPHTRHPLNEEYIPEAIADGRYFAMPLSEDKDFSEEEVAQIEKAVGSRKSIAFQIEGECKWELTDPGDLVFKEWSHYHNRCLVDEIENPLILKERPPLPQYYFPLVHLDWGFRHFTSVQYSYWDFEKNLWMIIDELWTRGKTSPDMIKLIRERAATRFPNPPHPITYYGDLTSTQQAEDVRKVFKFYIITADKNDNDVAKQAIDAMIADESVRIHQSCRALLHQLMYGCYKNDGSQRYLSVYTKGDNNLTGDNDSLDAFIYGWKVLQRFKKRNPAPVTGTWVGNQFYVDEGQETEGELKLLHEEEHLL